MDGTSVGRQERAFSSPHTQTDGVLRGIDMLTPQFVRSHVEKCSEARDVVHAQIDPTFPRAASRASGLAGEPHTVETTTHIN